MNSKHRNLMAACILALSSVFLVLGVLRDEHTTVWIKAVNICMECIGLG